MTSLPPDEPELGGADTAQYQTQPGIKNVQTSSVPRVRRYFSFPSFSGESGTQEASDRRKNLNWAQTKIIF